MISTGTALILCSASSWAISLYWVIRSTVTTSVVMTSRIVLCQRPWWCASVGGVPPSLLPAVTRPGRGGRLLGHGLLDDGARSRHIGRAGPAVQGLVVGGAEVAEHGIHMSITVCHVRSLLSDLGFTQAEPAARAPSVPVIISVRSCRPGWLRLNVPRARDLCHHPSALAGLARPCSGEGDG